MINRSTALSLMNDIWRNDDIDNELKKAYFGDHPLHDEAVDAMWALNWFANGHPQDDGGKPLPLARLAPDEQRAAVEGLKAVYPLRSEIDKRQGAGLPWERIAPEGARNIAKARQKYLQEVDPRYSTALHDGSHPAHDAVTSHHSAWHDWQSGERPGPAPRWGDLDLGTTYGRKAVSPLRNPWTAASLADPDNTGLLGNAYGAGARGAATPDALVQLDIPKLPTGDGGHTPPPGPASPSILKALSHLFAANVAGHLGLDPPDRLATDATGDGADIGSSDSNPNPGGFKTLKYIASRDGQPKLTADPSRPDRDGQAKFLRVSVDDKDGATTQQIAQAPHKPNLKQVDDQDDGDREQAFEAAQGAQGGIQGQERNRDPAYDPNVPIAQRTAIVQKRLAGVGMPPEWVQLYAHIVNVSEEGRSKVRDRVDYHLRRLSSQARQDIMSLIDLAVTMDAGDPRRVLIGQFAEQIMRHHYNRESAPRPALDRRLWLNLRQGFWDSLVGEFYANMLNGEAEIAEADAIRAAIDRATARGTDTVPHYESKESQDYGEPGHPYGGRSVIDLDEEERYWRGIGDAKRAKWLPDAERRAAEWAALPKSRDLGEGLVALFGNVLGEFGTDGGLGTLIKLGRGLFRSGRAVAGGAKVAKGERTIVPKRAGDIGDGGITPPQSIPTGKATAKIDQLPNKSSDLPVGAPGRGKSFPINQAFLESLRDVAATPEMRAQIKSYAGNYRNGVGPIGERALDTALGDSPYIKQGYTIVREPVIPLAGGAKSWPDRIILKPDGMWRAVGRGLTVVSGDGKIVLFDYGQIEGILEAKIGTINYSKGQRSLRAQLKKDGYGHLFQPYRTAYKDIPTEEIAGAIKSGFPNGKLPDFFDEEKLMKFIERHKPRLTGILIFVMGNAIARGEIEEF